MSITSRLFRKPWEHPDPAARARAVAEGDEPELLEALPRIAEHDEDSAVRLAALKRIDNEPFWLDARLRESDPAILAAADAHLQRAVMRHADERLVKERVEWLRRIDDPELIRRVAQHAPDRAMREEALSRIDAPGFLGDRVVEEADEDLALSLLERIDQVSTLERIGAALKKKNKRRARAVEDRLHAVQTASGEFDPVADSATRLVEQVERLARGELAGDRAGMLAELEDRWQRIASPPDKLARRFEGAVSIVHRALQSSTGQRAAPEASEAEPAAAAVKSDQAAGNHALEAAVNALDGAEPDRVSPDRAAALIGDFDRAWSSIEQPSQADQALRERALARVRALQQVREQAAGHAAAPPAHAEDDFGWPAHLDRAAELLEAGHLADAQATLSELRSRFDRLPKRQRPRAAGGRLNRLEGRMRELRNWEHWSNNKIRDELIERIEALADSDAHPDAITAALKEARGEWQRLEDLEAMPGDRQRHAAPAGQWRRFQAACKTAFEQAQPFFEKRHEVQAENLEALDAFIERGLEVAAEETATLETLKQFMRKSRLAIRRLDDLPPKSRGRAAARLRELMDRLSRRLDETFEAVESVKRRLVAEARQLEHESDLKTAIDKAKALQTQWQKAGTGRRRIEQQLWREFREPIDPLFEKLRGHDAERQAQQRAEIDRLEQLCKDAEALAACDQAELDGAQGRMRALRADWAAAGWKPGKLQQRFERAQGDLHKRIAARDQAAHQRIAEQHRSLARTIQTLYEQLDDGQTAAGALPDFEPLDALAGDLLARARQLADPDQAPALAAQVEDNHQAARQVLIELEFLAGLDSPESERQARMNYQVERLARRLGERHSQPPLNEEIAALRERWYRSFPLPAAEFEAMAKRFEKCQNALDSMSGAE